MELLQTTLCYLEQNGCYLMLHRVKKQNDVNHDKWIGVGGKFEPGETAETCVRREVYEETGLTANTSNATFLKKVSQLVSNMASPKHPQSEIGSAMASHNVNGVITSMNKSTSIEDAHLRMPKRKYPPIVNSKTPQSNAVK